MDVCSKIPSDLNLALTRRVGPMDYPSSLGRLESNFSGVGKSTMTLVIIVAPLSLIILRLPYPDLA